MRNKIISTATLSSLLLVSLSYMPSAYSQNKAENNIKFRQSGFMFMRWNMGIIKKNVIKKPESFNREKVVTAAKVLESISKSGIQILFTPDTQTGKGWKKTRVKPDFFRNPEKVQQYFSDLATQTERLRKISEHGSKTEIKQQFKTVLKACKTCHKSYRSKK